MEGRFSRCRGCGEIVVLCGVCASVKARCARCAKQRPFIQETLAKYPRLRASRIWSMVKQRGYLGSKSAFRAIVSRLRPRPHAEAYLRRAVLAGQEAQVDWAHFGKLTVGRAVRELWAFVMVLSYSRLRFVRFSLRAAMPSFLRGHVESFRFFGAVPRVLLYDNLKSAVLEREGDAVRFHPTLLELAGHYRFARSERIGDNTLRQQVLACALLLGSLLILPPC